MIQHQTLVSADEFLEIQTPDTVRLELDEGVLAVSPHNVYDHQHAALGLLFLLADWAKRTGAGIVVQEMDVVLNEGVVRAPDIALIAQHQRKILKRRKIVGAPHLVIEILSESTADLDRGRKAEQYAAAGVRHYWLVDPAARTFETFENDRGAFRPAASFAADAVATFPEFEGLRIELSGLWLDELPED